jgi:hypothetical protein
MINKFRIPLKKEYINPANPVMKEGEGTNTSSNFSPLSILPYRQIVDVIKKTRSWIILFLPLKLEGT